MINQVGLLITNIIILILKDFFQKMKQKYGTEKSIILHEKRKGILVLSNSLALLVERLLESHT